MPPPVTHRIVEAMAREVIGQLQAASLVTHRGERGRAREYALSQYLRRIVPPGFVVDSGFILDSLGGQSRQQDIVIRRRDYHPVFEVGGVRYFTVESVAIVIEVKSQLDSTALTAALSNAASVKSLDRTGGGANYIVIGGAGGQQSTEALDPDKHEHQVLSLIVSAEAAQLATLIPVLQNHLATHPRRQWPNVVAVAQKWSLSYVSPTPDVPRSNQMIATQIGVADVTNAYNVEPLIDVAEHILSFLRVSPLIDVSPNRYIQGSYHATQFASLPTAGHP